MVSDSLSNGILARSNFGAEIGYPKVDQVIRQISSKSKIGTWIDEYCPTQVLHDNFSPSNCSMDIG